MTIICPICRGSMRWHNEKYMCPVCGYDDTPKSTVITRVKVKTSDEFICPKCGRHTALVCRTDDTYQAHCMICDVYYDVEIENVTNADRIRKMTDEELAEYLEEVELAAVRAYSNDDLLLKGELSKWWLKRLKKEAET